jgi:hypothetical protein
MSTTSLLLLAPHAHHKDLLAKLCYSFMPKPQQRSTEDLAKHKQSMSARKTMFQQKKKENKAKGPKAATAHEKAEAEASAPRRIQALEESESEEENNEGRHLSEEERIFESERIDVDSGEEQGEPGEAELPATSAGSVRNSATTAATLHRGHCRAAALHRPARG